MKLYPEALHAFKIQLKISWICDNKNLELSAYDNIGLAYFYMGDLDGAEYYHGRMINGIIEPINSPTRIRCIGKLKKSKKKLASAAIQRKQQDTNLKYTQILQMFNLSNSEKADLLFGEIKLNEGELETPRVTAITATDQTSKNELPSPRQSRKLGTDPLMLAKINQEKIQQEIAPKKTNGLWLKKQQQRAIIAKLQQISQNRVFFSNMDFTKYVEKFKRYNATKANA